MGSDRTGIHALRELLQLDGLKSGPRCRISKHSRDVTHLENGIRYCFVEVTCENGVQYGIQGFGAEAVELHDEALKWNDPLRAEEGAIALVH